MKTLLNHLKVIGVMFVFFSLLILVAVMIKLFEFYAFIVVVLCVVIFFYIGLYQDFAKK